MNAESKMKLAAAFRFFGTVLVVFGILIWRNQLAYFRPEFWAEDGVVFFRDALQLGWRSLFIPLGGYQNLIPRLVALASVHLSIPYTPHIFVWFSGLSSAFMLAFIVSTGFSWIIPNHWMRFFLAVLFSLAPGSLEITQALCNQHTVYGLFGVLFLLHQRNHFGIGHWMIWFLLLLSSPEFALLIPVCALYWLIHRNSHSLWQIISITFLMIWNAYSSQKHGGGDYGFHFEAGFRLLRVTAERMALHSFFLPFLGPVTTAKLMGYAGWIYFTLALLFAGCLGAVIRKLSLAKRHLHFIYLFMFLSGAYFALVYVTRPYLWHQLQLRSQDILWGSRYVFISTCLTSIVWVVLALHMAKLPHFRWLSYIVVALLPIQLLLHPNIPESRPNLNWQLKGQRISSLWDDFKAERIDQFHVSGLYLQPRAYTQFEINVKR